jgi:hypothetical protein
VASAGYLGVDLTLDVVFTIDLAVTGVPVCCWSTNLIYLLGRGMQLLALAVESWEVLFGVVHPVCVGISGA